MATVNIGNIKFNWKGPWSSSTTYAVDDVVSLSGSSYISIQAGSNQNPASASAYWQQMSSAGAAGAEGGTSTFTTRGDLLFRGASAPARLAKGTAGYYLKQGANDPEWAEVAGGGLSASGSSQNVYKHILTSTVDISSTSYTDTGMNLSGFSALSANTDFIVYYTEARRENSWNQTGGKHMYSVDNGSNWIDLNETMEEYDTSNQNYSENNVYQTQAASYYLTFTSGQTPRFKVMGRKFGGSNNYRLNETGNTSSAGNKSSIIAVKVTP